MADVTDQLASIVNKAGIQDGSLHASVVGSTGSITTIELLTRQLIVENAKGEALRRLLRFAEQVTL